MATAASFLVERFFYRIVEFLRHWYVRSARIFWAAMADVLLRLDYIFAIKVTAKNIFRPLYGDYSAMGYVLGFLFRLGRVITASFVYMAVFVAGAGLYAVWALVPIALVLWISGAIEYVL